MRLGHTDTVESEPGRNIPFHTASNYVSSDAILTKHSLTRLQSIELAKCVRKVRNCPQEERHQWEEHCLEREENSLKKNDGVDRVGGIRDGGKDKCERS